MNTSGKPDTKATTEIEIQRSFNELRRELLDDRMKSVDWWLTATAIFLTLFGVVVVLGGYFGFKRFREIEDEARQSAMFSGQHAEEAQNLVNEIKAKRDEAVSYSEDIRKMTAEAVVNDPNRASEAAESVRENLLMSPIDRAIASAISLQQRERIEEAIEKWQSIANIAEGTDRELGARAWFSIGYLYGERSDFESAIIAYDNAIQLDPDGSKAYSNRGVEKSNLGQYQEAIADYDEAIRRKPDNAEAYSNRGNARSNLGQYQKAITDYDEAIRRKPDLAEAYNNRGVAKGNLGQCQAAVSDYDEAIRRKPDYVEAYNNRGGTKAVLGQYQEAIADYGEAIRLKPDYAGVYFNRGNTYRVLNLMEEARRDFRQALSLAQEQGNEVLAEAAKRNLRELDGEENP